jgi:F0F1-type ATP synthase gamma subunit
VWQQIAAMRTRKIKDRVLQNRDYYDSLLEVYYETLSYYLKVVLVNKDSSRSYNIKGNGKSVRVLLTANTGLYGAVLKNTFDLFLQDAENSLSDIVVTGRVGKNWMAAVPNHKVYKYFDVQDSTDNLINQAKELFNYITQYSDIYIYHGYFKNISEQPSKVTKISRNLNVNYQEEETQYFLFEPTVEKVLDSFNDQLRYSLFDQSIYESSLAKFGSRMMALDSATQKISKTLLSSKLSSLKMKHRKQNKKQTELLSSSILWR